MNDSEMRSNIWKYYLIVSLAYFSFFTPIIQLFYLDKGLSILQISVLGVIWTVVKMLAEIPSSILADRWGRKKVISISFFFAVLQLLVIVGATDYRYFILASICSAISIAFLSGTDVAFFYDTLKAIGEEKRFDKFWARQQIYQQVPLIISFTASGLLYKLSPLLPFWFSIIFLIFSFLITLTLKEPDYHKPIEKISWLSHFGSSVKFILNNGYLKSVLLFTIFFSLGSDLSYGYAQVYLKLLSLPVILFGIVYTLKSIFCTIAANLVPSIKKTFSFKSLFGFQIISLTLLLYLMVLTNNYFLGAAYLVLICIPYGFFEISRNDYMHQHIESHQRATIGSIFAFFIAAMFLIVEPLTGYLADIYSIKLPFLLVAIVMSIYCIYYYASGYKRI